MRSSDLGSKTKPYEECEEAILKTKLGIEEKAWVLEISTLEELIEFKRKIEEEVIIREWYENDDVLLLEIYDCYRE